MAKIARNGSSGKFTVRSGDDGAYTTIRDQRTGKLLPLKGYGALKGQFKVKKGLNLSKPIAAQVAKKSGKKTAAKAR